MTKFQLLKLRWLKRGYDDMFTFEGGWLMFWYNDINDSTRVTSFKSITWYVLNIKLWFKKLFR